MNSTAPFEGDRDSAVRVSNLVKRYGNVVAVDDLSFEVAPGEFFGFLGPNGAGKTTTINAIVGLATFQSGAISMFGARRRQRSAARRARYIGLSPQEFNFDRYLTVRDILHLSRPAITACADLQVKPRAEELWRNSSSARQAQLEYLQALRRLEAAPLVRARARCTSRSS